MLWFERFDHEVADLKAEILFDEPLSRHSSFRIGGPARRMAFPADLDQLRRLTDLGRDCGGRPLILGNGTNVLFPDEGLDRLVISTRDLCEVLFLFYEFKGVRMFNVNAEHKSPASSVL